MIDFLVSVNKVSLVIFLITLAGLVYEYLLFKKESRREKTPKLPQFKENYAPAFEKGTKVMVFEKKEEKKSGEPPRVFFLLIIIMIFFALLTLIGFLGEKRQKEQSQSVVVPTVVEERVVASSGIEIYNKDFYPLKEEEIAKLKPGDKILIGIKTVPGADIDKARIRVNKDFWEIGDETKNFDSKTQVFYIEYQIASSDSKLKIEAQLHSVTEGWLGE